MSEPITTQASRDHESRDARTAAVTVLVVRDPRLAGIATAGSVMAECTLGFA